MNRNNNNPLQQLIENYVRETLAENRMENRIRRIVSEELRKNYITESDVDNKRAMVMNALKDPKFNHAQIAYSLYHPKDQGEKDTVRSLFSKKATGQPDADGAIRHFTDDEINKIYQLIRKK